MDPEVDVIVVFANPETGAETEHSVGGGYRTDIARTIVRVRKPDGTIVERNIKIVSVDDDDISVEVGQS